jgi:hypothetical protein
LPQSLKQVAQIHAQAYAFGLRIDEDEAVFFQELYDLRHFGVVYVSRFGEVLKIMPTSIFECYEDIVHRRQPSNSPRVYFKEYQLMCLNNF